MRRLLLSLIVSSLSFSFSIAEEKPRQCRWQRGDVFHGYVICNGKKVDALYNVKNDGYVMLGDESYIHTAVDTAIAGRVEVPWKVTAPDGHVFRVMGVGRYSFADCRRLTEVILPDSLHDIGDQAFMNCRSLRQIVLPPGTKYLWPYAFRGCSNLQRVVVKGTVPPDSYNDVFDERTLRFATLVVPAASADAFRHAFVWNMFRYFSPDWDKE